MGSFSITPTSSSSGNGIDVLGIVNQILYANRAPERAWQKQQTTINAQVSALQAINSDLQDLKTKVNALKDLGGAFAATTVSVSNSSILTATAGAGATAGTHTVVVGSLATTSSYFTAYQASSSTPLTTGSFILKVGSNPQVTVTVDTTNNTLAGLATSVNNLSAGVTASVITDASGARLSIVSNTSGAAGDLTISSDTVGLGFTKAVTGVNGSATVDGVPVTSASNSLTSVIPGVTLNLLSASTSQVTVSVQADPTQVTQAVNNFVTSYNKLAGDINVQFQYNSTTKSAGVLAGDSTLRILQQNLLSDINASVPAGNSITNLAALGVNLNQDGTLTVNSAQLQSALSGNYQDVQNFFQTASTGFAQVFSSDLTNLTNATTGPVNLEINSLNSNSSSITNQIQDFESRLATTQQQLIDQYSKIDATLRQLPMLLARINSQLQVFQK